MCCVDQRTGFALAFVGIVLCALLSICSVALPGWAAKETEGQTVYAGLFFTCFNDTLSRSGCVVGDPFEDTGRVCVCVCVWLDWWVCLYLCVYICVCACVCVCVRARAYV